MDHNNQESYTLTLRLPKNAVELIDEVATALSMSRTGWIRKAITRNLTFAKLHELPLVQRPEIRAALEG